MNVFLYEWITGGGLVEESGRLPASLLVEGSAIIAALAADLRRLVRDSQVVDAPAELRTFSYDASFLTQLSPHAPDVAVIAGSAADVPALVRYAAERDIPITPRGADLMLMQRAQLHAAETHVWAALDRLQVSGAQIRPIVRAGQPAAEIVRCAQTQDADLLVIGARGQSRAEPFPLGGVAEKLIRFAPCSVLVAR